jgi:hypothetical protein
MRLRQTEGFMSSVLDLMGIDVPVPDHTTLSRRTRSWELSSRRNRPLPGGPAACAGRQQGFAGQWLEEKHGARSRRSWRKLHLALDANSGEIVAHRLTDQNRDDPSQVEPLLSQIDGKIDRFMADGAYDGKPAYQMVLRHSSSAIVVVPPRSTAVESGDTGPPGQRDRHIAAIARNGRLKWQAATGYGKRARIETAIAARRQSG